MMMAIAMMFENAIPTRVSMRMRANSPSASEGVCLSGFLSGSIRCSSASGGLPDKKIWRDRCTQQRDQRHQECAVPLDSRQGAREPPPPTAPSPPPVR
jgi:hypothetical protein